MFTPTLKSAAPPRMRAVSERICLSFKGTPRFQRRKRSLLFNEVKKLTQSQNVSGKIKIAEKRFKTGCIMVIAFTCIFCFMVSMRISSALKNGKLFFGKRGSNFLCCRGLSRGLDRSDARQMSLSRTKRSKTLSPIKARVKGLSCSGLQSLS